MGFFSRPNEEEVGRKLLRDFHSRDVKQSVERPWESRLAEQKFYRIGDAVVTDYYSDKDDPETRAPHKRKHDPDGVQGIRKYFTHKHTMNTDSGNVGLYTTASNYVRIYPKIHGSARGKRPVLPTEVLELSAWPSVLTYLSDLAKIDFITPDDRRVAFQPRVSKELRDAYGSGDKFYKLHAFPDTHTLIALPDPNVYDDPEDEIYIWRGGILHVTYRGIQG